MSIRHTTCTFTNNIIKSLNDFNIMDAYEILNKSTVTQDGVLSMESAHTYRAYGHVKFFVQTKQLPSEVDDPHHFTSKKQNKIKTLAWQ